MRLLPIFRKVKAKENILSPLEKIVYVKVQCVAPKNSQFYHFEFNPSKVA